MYFVRNINIIEGFKMEKIILPEIVSIGIYNSNTAVKNQKITKNRKTTMFEIELPIEDGGISFINSESSPIVTNMIICAKKGQIRHTLLPYKCYYIHMIIPEGKLYNILTNVPNFIPIQKPDCYLEIFRELCKYYDSALETDEIKLQSIVLELICNLHRDSEKILKADKIKKNNEAIINETIKYIKENLTSDLSLGKLSNLVHLSQNYFHKCFKQSTGKTLRDYVEEQRIKKAVHLLVTSDLSLAEIAFECGFSSQSYFNYVFKRRMKKTPRKYAEEINERYYR